MVRAQPSADVGTLLQRGAQLNARGLVSEAYASYIAALEQAPADARVQTRVGDFLLARGELDEANSLYSMAASQGDVGGLCGLVEVCERRGKLDRAWAMIERVPAALDHSLALRVVAARVLARRGQVRDAAGLLQSVDTRPLSDNDAAGVGFALGDLHDELGEPELAFEAWRAANARRGLRFDRDQYGAAIDAMMCRYRAGALEGLPRGNPSDRPIFIVGAPRSGTTLVEQILAAHPHVHGAGELPDINALFAVTDHEQPAEIRTAATSYLERLQTLDRNAQFITDKMPFNAMRLGFIAQLFPNARVIHCVRDPQDTAISIFGRNFSDWHTYATKLENIGCYIGHHERLMEHWQAVLPVPILEVGYEQLAQRGAPAIRWLLDALALPWDPAVLRFHEATRSVRSASYAQVHQPLYTTSIGRSRGYVRHLHGFERARAEARDQPCPIGVAMPSASSSAPAPLADP